MNEFRQDPVTGNWVIISGERDRRPNEFARTHDDKVNLDAVERDAMDIGCPFCARQMDTPPLVAQYGTNDSADPWQVCVVPNLYPVLNSSTEDQVSAPKAGGLLDSQPAFGQHEVVIESPTHQVLTGELSRQQYFYMLQAYRDRMLAMCSVPGIAYALAMKNSGQEAGASLRHTHSQIFGLPMIPQQVRRELDGSSDYFGQHQRCVFCDLIDAEIRFGDRIVAKTRDFVAWCPHASRFGYEIWLAPRAHSPRFEDSNDTTLLNLADLLRKLIRKVDQNSRVSAFNYLLHSQPFDTSHQDHYHWHIEILPRIAKQAGFEWGTGIHINTVVPSQAASELRIEGYRVGS